MIQHSFIVLLLLHLVRCVGFSQEVQHISPGCCAGTFSLLYASHTVTDLSGITNTRPVNTPRQITDVQLTAVITFQTISVTTAYVQLDSTTLTYTVNDIPQTYLAKRVTKELQQPVMVQYDSTGHVQSINVHFSVSSEATALIASIVTQLQYTSKNEQGTYIENDRTGTYSVTYTTSFSAAPQHTITKEKNGYGNTNTAVFRYSTTPTQHAWLSGRQQSIFSELQSKLTACSGTDSQTVYLGDIPVAKSVNVYTFKQCKSTELIPVQTFLTDSTLVLNIPEGFNRHEIKKAGMSSVMGTSSVIGILDSLDKLTPNDSAMLEILPRKLYAACGLHSEFGDSLLQRVTRYHHNDTRQRIIADCLTREGSEQNQQRFLQQLTLQKSNTSILPFLISCFGNIQQPTLPTQSTLLELAFKHPDSFVRSTAQLAIGAMANLLSATTVTDADSLIQHVLQHASELRPKQLLNILGNSGLHSTFVTIRTIYDTSQAELRSRALYSMRFIQHEQIDSILAGNLTLTDSLMQSTALRTLVFRQPTAKTLRRLVEVVTNTTTKATILKEAAALLRKWNSQFPFVRATMYSQAQELMLSAEALSYLRQIIP